MCAFYDGLNNSVGEQAATNFDAVSGAGGASVFCLVVAVKTGAICSPDAPAPMVLRGKFMLDKILLKSACGCAACSYSDCV